MLGQKIWEGLMDRRTVLGVGIGAGLAAAALSKQALADTVVPGDGVLPSDPKENIIALAGHAAGRRRA